MTPARRLLALALTVAFAASLLSGCAGKKAPSEYKSWLAAGATLNEVGQQFRLTADLYSALYTQKKIDSVEYVRFIEFAKDFQALYPVAVQGYKEASSAKDANEAITSILNLKSKLLTFYIFGLDRKGK